MGCRDFQNKHCNTELNTCSVCSVYAGTDAKIQDCIDAKIKEKIDDANIANLREQFRKQCTMLFSCVKSTCYELLTLLAPIARSVAFWFQKHK